MEREILFLAICINVGTALILFCAILINSYTKLNLNEQNVSFDMVKLKMTLKLSY